MNATRRRFALMTGTILLLGWVEVGCVRQPVLGTPASGVDRKLSTFAYIEEGDLVTLIVDTRATRDRDQAGYLPLEIAIANRGLKQLTLRRESFTLADSEGRRYPMASPTETLGNYQFLEFDRTLAELEGIVFNRFGAFTRYPSNFSPTLTLGSGRTNVVQDLVSLPRFGYLIDLIYFPVPEGGVLGRRFELFVDAPELADPLFVRFEVR